MDFDGNFDALRPPLLFKHEAIQNPKVGFYLVCDTLTAKSLLYNLRKH